MKGPAAVQISNVIFQVLVISSMAILPSFYDPGDFGKFAVITGLTQIIGVAASFRYEFLMTGIKDDSDANSLFALCVLLVLCTSSICATFAVAVHIFIPNLVLFIDCAIAVFGVLTTGLLQSAVQYRLRNKQLNCIAAATLAQGLMMFGAQLAFAQSLWHDLGLQAGFVLGVTASLLVTFPCAQLKGVFSSAYNMPAQARKHFQGAMHSSVSTVFASLSNHLPTILISGIFNSQVAGQFFLALRISSIPGDFVGRSTSQITLASIGTRTDELQHVFDKVRISASALIKIGFVPLVVLTCSAPLMLPMLLGPGWGLAGTFLALLFFGGLLNFLVSSLIIVFPVIGHSGFISKKMLFLVFARITSVITGYLISSVSIGVFLFSLSTAVTYVSIALGLFKILEQKSNWWWRELRTEFFISIPFGIIVILANVILPIPGNMFANFWYVGATTSIFCTALYLRAYRGVIQIQ
jgi:O-antigen/teichoic acid export membrane protein